MMDLTPAMEVGTGASGFEMELEPAGSEDEPDFTPWEEVEGEASSLSGPLTGGSAVREGTFASGGPVASAQNGNGYKTNGNGNGNSKSNGNGRKATNGRKRCHFQVMIPRHGTDDQDLELLRQVYNALSSWHGEDTYELCIVNGSKKTYMEIPDATTALSLDLESTLKALLGPDCLTLCER